MSKEVHRICKAEWEFLRVKKTTCYYLSLHHFYVTFSRASFHLEFSLHSALKFLPTPFTLCSMFLTGSTERKQKRVSLTRAIKWSSSVRARFRGAKEPLAGHIRGRNKKQKEIGPRYRRTWFLRRLEEANFKIISRVKEDYFDLCDDQRPWRQEQRPWRVFCCCWWRWRDARWRKVYSRARNRHSPRLWQVSG